MLAHRKTPVVIYHEIPTTYTLVSYLCCGLPKRQHGEMIDVAAGLSQETPSLE